MINNTLPPLIMTSDENSFAQKTIRERKPQIINQILSSQDFTPAIRQSFLEFKIELASGRVLPLHEDASDTQVWHEELQPWIGKSWFELPWLLAEAYFYRRVLEITTYFQPGPYSGLDPFARLKYLELLDGCEVFEEIYPALTTNATLEDFKEICIKALWGNRGDLSHMDALDPNMATQSNHIILDHTDAAFHYLSSIQPGMIAYFLDNVGKELYFDLALIDYLIRAGLASKVTCYMKNQPFFVSDAMPKDMLQTMERMMASDTSEVRLLSHRIEKGIRSGKIRLEAPPFLTHALTYRELSPVFRDQLSAHDLVILKGDVNYRRLVDDRHWPPKTPVNVAAGYFPAPFLSLRTLKAELVVGLTDEILSRVENESDPDWLINGKRGLITFYQK
jgi:uncharacterized protein with ATP-grasp and redox domains